MSKNSVYGPEESWDPLVFLEQKSLNEFVETKRQESFFTAPSENTSAEPKQKIFLKTDSVSEASGSSYIEIGNVKLLCSVYGPRDIPRRDDYDFKVANLNCEFRFAAFSCLLERRGTLSQRDQALDEKNLSATIEEALKPSILLHKYPKSQIDLYILCIQNDVDSRNVLSASIVAASMALANASIELYDLIASYTYLPVNLTVAYMPQLHQITSIYFSNEKNGATLSAELFKSHVKECVENCKKVYSLMRFILVSNDIGQEKNGLENGMKQASIEDESM
jgi:exosome complex component MTR3